MSASQNDGPTEPSLVQAYMEKRLSRNDLLRQSAEASVRACRDTNTLRAPSHSICWAFNMMLQGSRGPGDLAKDNLQHLWWNFYLYAKYIDAGSAAMSRLAFQLVQVREQGKLLRHAEGGGFETVLTSDGVVWSDLPFFVSEMHELWAKDCATMSSAHRINFSRFLSKLASISLADDQLCGIALILFREALETPRPLGEMGTHVAEDSTRSMADLTICDLLPSLNSWLAESSKKIIQLADKSRHDFPSEAQVIGVLYRDDERSALKAPGFSPARWLFWLRRLDTIHHDAEEGGKQDIADYVELLLGAMFGPLRDILTSVRTEFEANPGLVKYRPRVHRDPPASAQREA